MIVIFKVTMFHFELFSAFGALSQRSPTNCTNAADNFNYISFPEILVQYVPR